MYIRRNIKGMLNIKIAQNVSVNIEMEMKINIVHADHDTTNI